MTKLALITGASGGIGQSISEKLAQNGYDLLLHYHTNEKAAASLAERLSHTYGIHAEIIHGDLSDPGGAKTVSASIGGRALDGIVLNSGQSFRGLVTDMTDEAVQDMVQAPCLKPVSINEESASGDDQEKVRRYCSRQALFGVRQGRRAKFYTA